MSRPARARTTRPRLACTAVTLAALLLGGCSGAADRSASGRADGSLTLAVGGEPDDGFDPTTGWGRYGAPLFQSTLLRRTSDLSWTGDLATSYELSRDGLTWTIALREDATFSDGTPLTSADVVHTFEAAAEAGGLADLTALESARADGEFGVILRLKRPQSTFVNRLISLGIVPAASHGDDYARNPIGSGPFTLVRWEPGQQLIVEANEDYYGQAPQFDRVTFLFSDEDATMAALRAGQVDLAGVPANLAGEAIAGHELVAIPSLDNRAVSFPTVPTGTLTRPDGVPVGHDVTADVAIRRAVNQAVDRQALVEGILDGHGSPAYGPVDEAPWSNPDSVLADADPEGARSALAAAGWVDQDGDGVREKDGRSASFTLWYAAGDSTRQNLAVALVDQLADIGVSVRTRSGSWEEIEQVMHSEPVLFGWGSQDPIEMYNLLASSQAGVEYNNPGYYADAEVDQHLEAALSATTERDATAHWKRAQVKSSGSQDAPWAWLVNLDHTYYVDSCLDLGNSITEPHGHGWPVTANITEWRWTC